MNYSINLYNANGDIIATKTAAAAFRWNGEHKAANDIYTTAAALVESTPTAAAFRVYPCNDTLLALRCAKTAAAVAANKGGKAASVDNMDGMDNGERKAAAAKAAAKASKQTAAANVNATQTAIDSDLRRITAATLAALCDNAALDVDSYIFEHIATANAHTQDFFSVCTLAALEAANAHATQAEKAAAIYKAANAYTYASKAAAARDVSTEWIIDGGGDLVAFGTAAASILKGGERWTPTAAANMDTETAAALGETLAAAYATLSPTERKIAMLIVTERTQEQIAAALGYANKSTVCRKIAAIRKAYMDYITANAPQFVGIIRNAETKAAAAAAKRGHDKTQAERMRRYRERKAAAKAAANG